MEMYFKFLSKMKIENYIDFFFDNINYYSDIKIRNCTSVKFISRIMKRNVLYRIIDYNLNWGWLILFNNYKKMSFSAVSGGKFSFPIYIYIYIDI